MGDAVVDRSSWTISLLVLGAIAFTPAIATDLPVVDRSGPTPGAVGGVDRRPEGMTPAPYDLETFETSMAAMPIVAGDPATFELFGFKLGMSVREADRNARRRHLRFNGNNGTNPSFGGRVAIAAATLLGRKPPKVPRVLGQSSMIDADGARYALQFLPMEAGATLVSIAYFGTLQGNSPAQYLAALQQKFGKPTHRSANSDRFDARWCSKGDQALALCDDRPAFAAGGGTDVVMELLLGSRARRDLDARIEAKAKALAATERKAPSF